MMYLGSKGKNIMGQTIRIKWAHSMLQQSENLIRLMNHNIKETQA
jgi:hypothetical protein